MNFRIHERVLDYYDPEYIDFVFVNTVTGNKEIYSKPHLKAA